MKKSWLILILVTVFFISGCASENAEVPQVSPTAELVAEKDDLNSNISQLDEYMSSLEEKALIIEDFLEHDAVTQTDMNMKSQELYELWDDALNYIWDELKHSLPEEEFAKLLDEQLTWIAEKELAQKEAGKDFEGGSIYPLIVNSEAARITEERVYELYALLKEAAG